jgi:hypothetical protein
MNPLCFRKLSITNPATGKTVTATATDKCEGCVCFYGGLHHRTMANLHAENSPESRSDRAPLQ